MLETIFVVTTIQGERKSTRTVAWYPTLERALDAVAKDAGAMSDCLYDYAVVEEMAPGVYPEIRGEWWYQWHDDGEWKQIATPDSGAKPEWAVGICNWGIG